MQMRADRKLTGTTGLPGFVLRLKWGRSHSIQAFSSWSHHCTVSHLDSIFFQHYSFLFVGTHVICDVKHEGYSCFNLNTVPLLSQLWCILDQLVCICTGTNEATFPGVNYTSIMGYNEEQEIVKCTLLSLSFIITSCWVRLSPLQCSLRPFM